jgi:hypothetical protein
MPRPALKMFRFNTSRSILLLCSLLVPLLASSMHVTQAQELDKEGQEESTYVSTSSMVDIFDDNNNNNNNSDNSNNNNATTTHSLRGSIVDFERELQRAVRCVGRGASCRRTNDCCDPLSCRSNTCQVRRKEVFLRLP